MQRLFFALWPDDSVRARIAAVTAELPVRQGRRVPPENLHITLEFMGYVEGSARACAEAVADSLAAAPFEIRFDQLGFWPGPRILWLGASMIPESLIRLQSLLHEGLMQCGMELEDRPFKAHMTLMRKASLAGRIGAIDPIDWRVECFVLVESATHSDGAVYRVLKTWKLRCGGLQVQQEELAPID